jgi:hypothetical protein
MSRLRIFGRYFALNMALVVAREVKLSKYLDVSIYQVGLAPVEYHQDNRLLLSVLRSLLSSFFLSFFPLSFSFNELPYIIHHANLIKSKKGGITGEEENVSYPQVNVC